MKILRLSKAPRIHLRSEPVVPINKDNYAEHTKIFLDRKTELLQGLKESLEVHLQYAEQEQLFEEDAVDFGSEESNIRYEAIQDRVDVFSTAISCIDDVLVQFSQFK